MTLKDITFEQIVGLLVIAVIVAGAYNTIMAAVKTYFDNKKKRNEPIDALAARVDAHDRMLANDKRHLEEIDERLYVLKTESAMVLKGVRALLSHEINGNSEDKLKKSYDDIDNYLIGKGGQ